MTQEFAVAAFETKLQRALEHVRKVLGSAKAPCFAGDVHHQYEDKYFLAESVTNAAAASQLNCLSALGLSAEQAAQLSEWAKTSTVSLRLRSDERCTFLREESRDVEDPTRSVQELSVGGVVSAALTSKTVVKVTEYFWKLEVTYELAAIRGIAEQPTDHTSILTRTSRDELKTTTKTPPRPNVRVPACVHEVDISWLLRQLPAGAMTPAFTVDRSHDECHTPRRNPDVNAAEKYFGGLLAWANHSAGYLSELLQVQPDPSRRPDLGSLSSPIPFMAALPLLAGESSRSGSEAAAAEVEEPAGAVLARLPAAEHPEAAGRLGTADANRLIMEEARLIAERSKGLAEAFPGGEAVASAAEATLIVVLKHCGQVCNQWKMAMSYIEDLLRKQLITAIGREVSPADFAEYMRFHNRKLFADEYLPLPFCFAVRRSKTHTPEGTVSIEEEVVGTGGDSNVAMPIVTLAARSDSPHRMQFPINASTNVRFDGERFLHAWLSHRFSGQSGAQLSLVSRARQFSSMLVLVGRIASATTFEPKYAAIVQNKDELTIPLDLSTIPTPKEFKDAIESLSPEQQAFAKAFRSMQLESTLFGILVIQIKPQLEKVLNLPADSLTKEIRLTQDLMQMFIKYQIPSDLLSYDGGPGADGFETVAPSQSERLEFVKGHVKAMHDMIAKAKEEEIAEKRMEARYAAPATSPDCGWGNGGGSWGDDGGDLGFGSDMLVERSAAPPMAFFAAPKGGKGAAPAPKGGKGAAPPPPGGKGAAPAPKRGKGAAPAPPGGKGPAQTQALFCAAPSPAPAVASAEAPMAFAAPAAASAAPMAQQPEAQQPEAQQPQQPQAQQQGEEPQEEELVDYTQVPKELDRQFERLDTEGALRPTIISPGETWTKRAQKALLASPTTSTLRSDDQKCEKDAAFDLLDALTKSGALTVDHAALHVVVAATHCFDKTVTETVIQDNKNPIDKVERSTLIMASTIHRKPAGVLVRQSQYPRVHATSPMLFVEDGAD